MRAIDLLKSSMEMAMGYSESLLRDMADEPLVRTTPEHGQHAYWLLGHLALSEAAVLDQYILGRPNRFEPWRPLFATGAAPSDSTEGGPTYDELLEALRGVRAAMTAHVAGMTDDDLDRPCHENDWPGPSFDSVGACLSASALHMCIHAGQAACARRAAGRPPLHEG